MVACVAVMCLADPVAAAAPSVSPPSFIDALAAIPRARTAVASARLGLQLAVAQRTSAASVARAVRIDADTLTEDARLTGAALVRADLAVLATQDAIDDTARTMYTSGGSEPTLVDIMLTTESELGLMRSLAERRYLRVAGDRVLELADLAEGTRLRATSRLATVIAARERAAAAVAEAQAAVVAAESRVAVALSVVGDARARYGELMSLTKVDRSAEYGRIRMCGDWLTRLLSRSGFEGEDLREAWAIVMRESGGRASSVSDTGDLGLFQINTDTWQDEKWFDRDLLLRRRYNSRVAYALSRGGRTWYSWGLDGHGRPDPGAYTRSGWSDERIYDHIVLPYIAWYAQYPCRPAYEKDVIVRASALPPVVGRASAQDE